MVSSATHSIELLDVKRADAVVDFLRQLGGDDHTFLGTGADANIEAAVARWTVQADGRNRVAIDPADESIVGFVGIERGSAWSRHVGTLRVVVAPNQRGKGLGKALALGGLRDAVDLEITKVVVDVRSDQGSVIGLFHGLGFQPEALLADQLRSDDGQYFDLITLAHRTDQLGGVLATVGAGDVAL